MEGQRPPRIRSMETLAAERASLRRSRAEPIAQDKSLEERSNKSIDARAATRASLLRCLEFASY